MKILSFLLVFATLMMRHASLQAEEPTLFFARSGETIRIPGATQLRFLNAQIVSNSQGEFQLPSLRAPGLMQACDSSGQPILEFVVYPQRTLDLETTTERQAAVKLLGVPAWFEQWTKATRWLVETETPCLLILSSETAGDSPQAVLELMKQHHLKTSLVFSPRWAGPVRSESTSFTLAQVKGSLLQDYQPLGDPAPLSFPYRQTPCPKIMNRLSWLGPINGLPYIEELCFEHNRRIIVSYLPWQKTLGRHEQADRLFLHFLTKTAQKNDTQGELDFPRTILHLQWPRRWDIRDTERPILHHLFSCRSIVPPILQPDRIIDHTDINKTSERQEDSRTSVLHVVDLRGKTVQRAKHALLRKSLLHRPLLILGTDPAFDGESFKGENVIWFKNDTLPLDNKYLSENCQGGSCGQGNFEQPTGFRTGSISAYRLMETLTRFHVSLIPYPE